MSERHWKTAQRARSPILNIGSKGIGNVAAEVKAGVNNRTASAEVVSSIMDRAGIKAAIAKTNRVGIKTEVPKRAGIARAKPRAHARA